ncbi:MAG: hypothetical protein HN348_15415 [Proteobacteria bacterium]|nr:hypothetical protein [Pseudomonadota bacterium]
MGIPLALLETKCIAIAVGFLLLFAPSLSWATTIAVLPFTKGAGSEQYEGLGRALAGMVLTDLASVESLQLVERERLDALIQEMALAEGGFLDPATAQRVGRGVGAKVVVLGSFSIVDGDFLLDARLVAVRNGRVIKAANAKGPLKDFVGVEKDVVAVLLEDLDVTLSNSEFRKLLLQAPTDHFDAFVAYGEGLQRQEEGALDDAKRSFEEAIELDPAFTQAIVALRSLRTMLEEAREAVQREAADAHALAHDKVLSETTDERTRNKDFVHDKQSLAAFALRLIALENEERNCQRNDEMVAFLENINWQMPEEGKTISRGFSELAESFGVTRYDHNEVGPQVAKQSLSRVYMLFKSLPNFIGSGTQYKRDSALISTIRECFLPAEQPHEIERLLHRLRKVGAADEIVDRHSPFTLEDHLVIAWCWVTAESTGASPALQSRLDKLLARYEGDSNAMNKLFAWTDEVLRRADRWEQSHAARLGQSSSRLTEVMQGLAAQKSGDIVSGDNEFCDYILRVHGSTAAGLMSVYHERMQKYPNNAYELDSAGMYYGIARDFGCLRTEEGRFTSLEEVYEFADGAMANLDAEREKETTCIYSIGSMKNVLSDRSKNMAYTLGDQTAIAVMVVQIYYGLVAGRCVREQ